MKENRFCIDREILKKVVSLVKEYKLYANKTKNEEIDNVLLYIEKNKIRKDLNDFKPIIKESSKLYQVPIELMFTRSRKKAIVESRQYTMWKIKNNSKLSLQAIGDLVGGFDHATVLHACNVINNRIETNQLLFQIKKDVKWQKIMF